MTYDRGLVEVLYLNGANISIGPDSFTEKPPMEVRQDERMLDATLTTDRGYCFAGQPDVIQKYSFAVKWPRLTTSDYREFHRIRARAWTFDVCIWKPIVELFSGDASQTVFNLQRRQAISVISSGLRPTGYATKYPTLVYVGGTLKTVTTHYTIGTADALGRTPITFGTAPAAGDGNVEVFYVPLFLMSRVSDQLGMSLPHRQDWALEMVEV